MATAVPDASLTIDRRVSLAHEWDELIGRIREFEGYQSFLRPPRLDDLLLAAADGPVVVVNMSQWRCDALIVTTDGVKVQELPGLSADDADQRTSAYLQALEAAQRAAPEPLTSRHDGGDSGEPARPAARYDEMLGEIVEWLWDALAEPVLSALGITGTPEPGQPWPRLWWCPTGLLTLLPLHAAGYHHARGEFPPRTVADRVVSSYTPTLRALLDARSRPRPEGPGRLLVVALPEAPGQVPIHDVIRERDKLTRLFPGQHTLLDGPQATWDAVTTQLTRHRWAHFSCHGHQNLTDPSRGGLMLYDRALTIADISAGLHHGEFAFLSACKTATGGITLPDEAITLTAALHYTGYQHVIGTLWSVGDRVAADVAAAVYADLTSSSSFEPGRSAFALHAAVRQLRARGSRLPIWTPFIHTGP